MKLIPWLRKELPQILLLALPFALAAAWWDKIPAVVVTHWGIHGRPNGWMPKAPGLLLLPLLNVGMGVLIAFLPRIDPRLRRNSEANTTRQRRLWRTLRYIITGFISLMALAVIAIAAGWHLNMGRLCCNAALVLCAGMGNFLGNLEPNYLMGIRTPWTLEDADTWRATHRMVGRWMVFGAAALLAVGFFVSDVVQVGLLMAYMAGLGIGSLGYSAWYFNRRRAAA